MKKLSILALILCISVNAFGSLDIFGKAKLRAGAFIEYEGATNNNFETSLIVVDPTADRTVTIKDETGTVALMSDIIGGVFPEQNTIFVNASNGGSEDGTAVFPFNTIAEALTASTVLDLIRISPGTYAEALVIPHDLFVDGIGASGLLSIDVSSGALMGRIGDKWEFSRQGVLIHPDSDFQDNWDCVVFAANVGATQSDRYGIALLSGVYGLIASDNTIDLATAGFDLLDFGGVGNKPVIQGDPVIQDIFTNARSSSFHNLEINLLTPGETAIRGRVTAGDNSGDYTNLKSNGNVNLGAGTARWTGLVNNVEAFGGGTTSTTEMTGNVLNVISDAAGIWFVGPVGATSIVEVSSGQIELRTDIRGIVVAGNSPITNISPGVEFIDNGEIHFKNGADLRIGTNYQIVAKDARAETLFGNVVQTVVQDDSVLTHLRVGRLSILGTVIRDGVTFNGGIIGDGIQIPDLGSEIKATFNNITFNSSDVMYGFAVADGAIFNNSSFLGKTNAAAVEFQPNIIGRSIVSTHGNITLDTFWDDSLQTLVFPLSEQASEQDPSGTGKRLIPDLTVFNAFIRRLPTVSGPLDAVITLTVEFEFFEDVDTTPADNITDTHGFVTTGNNSIFTIRSTATDATALDNALGNPGADVTDTNTVRDAVVSQEATIKLNDCLFEGIPFGPEITISGQKQSVTLTADDTVILFENKYLEIISDNVTSTNRSFSISTSGAAPGDEIFIQFKDTGGFAAQIDAGTAGMETSGGAAIVYSADGQIASWIFDATNWVQKTDLIPNS